MTLLSVCAAAVSNIGIEDNTAPITSIVGNNTNLARRVFQQARRAAHSLAKRNNWTALVTEHVFTASGLTQFPLPVDFRSMINDTLWDRSRFWALRGALSPQEWQIYKSSIIGTATIEQRWRIRIPSGDTAGTPTDFTIDPVISATDNSTFVYEYVSSYWCLGADGVAKPDWTADTDTCLIDEDVLELGITWRLMRRLGLSYDEEHEEYEREVDKLAARDGGTATLNLSPTRRLNFLGPWNVQSGNFPA